VSLEDANRVKEARFRLQKNLDQWGYEEHAVPGDNNCQFHAVADQLEQNGDKGWHARGLRDLVCEWLREAGDRTMDEDGLGEHTTLKDACGVLDWKAYVTEMCLQDETWGDAATLLAVACIFEAEVVVISSVTDDCVSTILPPPHWKVPSRQRIILGHYHEYHYMSTRPTCTPPARADSTTSTDTRATDPKPYNPQEAKIQDKEDIPQRLLRPQSPIKRLIDRLVLETGIDAHAASQLLKHRTWSAAQRKVHATHSPSSLDLPQ